MNRKQLFEQIQAKKSMLCVGLDVDFNKMPEHIKALANRGELAIKGELYKGKARSIIEFNKAIVDATAPHCVAYKPNLAFYASILSADLAQLFRLPRATPSPYPSRSPTLYGKEPTTPGPAPGLLRDATARKARPSKPPTRLWQIGVTTHSQPLVA